MAEKMPRSRRSMVLSRAKAILDMVGADKNDITSNPKKIKYKTSKEKNKIEVDPMVEETINKLYARPYSMTSQVFDKFCETQTTLRSHHFQDLAIHGNNLNETFSSYNTTCESLPSQSKTPTLELKDLTCYEKMPSIPEEQQLYEFNSLSSLAAHDNNEHYTDNCRLESPLSKLNIQLAPDFDSDDSVRDKDYIPNSSDDSDDDLPTVSSSQKALLKSNLQASTSARHTPLKLLQPVESIENIMSKESRNAVDCHELEFVKLENVESKRRITVDAIQERTINTADCMPSKTSCQLAKFNSDSNDPILDKDNTSKLISDSNNHLTAATSRQKGLIQNNLDSLELRSDHPTEKAPNMKRRNTIDFREVKCNELKKVTRKRRNTIDAIQESGNRNFNGIPSKKRKLYKTSLAHRINEKKQIKIMEYTVKQGCNEKCLKKCSTHINEEQRKKLNQDYWSLTWEQRRLYIRQRIATAVPKRKYTKEPIRNPRRSFTLKTSDGNVCEVCKVFFLTTLGFKKSNDKVLRLIDNVNDVEHRGKHVKTPAYDRQLLNQHVESFHPYEPHHRREHAPLRRYLPSDINIRHMHKDYCEKNPSVVVSYELYRKHIKSMNISFTRLGNEECEVCESYHLHNKQTSHDATAQLQAECNICVQYSRHHEKYTKARQLYATHKDLPQNEKQIFFTADLEKVIMLPRMETFKSVIFCQRLIAFNQTFAPVGKITNSNKPVTVIWHDGIAGRKQDDIMSAFYAFLIRNRDVENVSVWLDNCSAQNKNWLLFSLLIHMVNSDLISTNNITLYFFEPGHTFMSSDQVHHQVELAMKKKGKLYDFQDFVDAVSSINNSKVIVQSLLPENFINIPNLISDRRIQKSNPRAYLKNMVQITFKRNDFDLYYKNNFDDEFTALRFMNDKYLKSPRIMSITFRSLPKGIDAGRKSTIIDKLAAIIPPHKLTFWNNLPTNDAAINEIETNDIRGRKTI